MTHACPNGSTTTTTDYVLDGWNVVQDIVRNEQNDVTGKTTYIYDPRGAERCIKKTIHPQTGQVTDEKWRWWAEERALLRARERA